MSYIENLIPFIVSMRKGVAGEEPAPQGTVVTTGQNLMDILDSLKIDTKYITNHLSELSYNVQSPAFGNTHPFIYGKSLEAFEDKYEDGYNLFTISQVEGGNYTGAVFIIPVLSTEYKGSSAEVFNMTVYFDNDGWVYQIKNSDQPEPIPFTVKDAIVSLIGSAGSELDGAFYVDSQLNNAFTY